MASLDSAFTKDQHNDPSGFTVWGMFRHPVLGKRRIILLDARRRHLQFSADRELIEWLPGERNVPLISQTDQNGQSASRYMADGPNRSHRHGSSDQSYRQFAMRDDEATVA
jgi:hypothetical protein